MEDNETDLGEAEEFFAGLQRQREDGEAKREDQRRQLEEALRPGWETKRAITLASYAKWTFYECTIGDPEDQPIGIEDHFNPRIVISNVHWAKRIIEAARLWRICPGFEVLKERPIPDFGPGYKAGERIFHEAANGASIEEIAEMLRRAREALGPWMGHGSSQPYSECELGLWGYFKQLDRYFDYRSWSLLVRQQASPAVDQKPPRWDDPECLRESISQLSLYPREEQLLLTEVSRRFDIPRHRLTKWKLAGKITIIEAEEGHERVIVGTLIAWLEQKLKPRTARPSLQLPPVVAPELP